MLGHLAELEALTHFRLRERDFWIFVALTFYFALFFFGTSVLAPAGGKDALSVAKLAETGAYSRIEGGYRATALIYKMTTPLIRKILTVSISLWVILYCYRYLTERLSLSILTVLFISPILFIYTQFVKDLMLMPFVVVTAITLMSKLPKWAKICFVVIIYSVYANAFRQYYYLILVVFFLLYISALLPGWLRGVLITAGVLALGFADSELFMRLQGQRDIASIDRVGRDIAGAKTAFLNLETPDNYVSFLKNYVYAAARLNLPFLFGARVQELFLFINVMVYMTLSLAGLFFSTIFRGVPIARDADGYAWAARTSALLFVAHVLVLICFEPDLGSYLRHMSVALPYLVPVLIAFDRAIPAWTARRRPPVWRNSARPRRASASI